MLLYQTVKPNSKEQPGLTGLCCVASAPYRDPSEPQRVPPCELGLYKACGYPKLQPPTATAPALPHAATCVCPFCTAPAADGKWLAFDLRLEEVRCACCGPAVHVMASLCSSLCVITVCSASRAWCIGALSMGGSQCNWRTRLYPGRCMRLLGLL